MRPWPRPDKIYFIATADRSMVKIGSSSRPLERLDAQLGWSPMPLELIAVAPGSYAEEFSLHRHFAAHHSHREWYRAAAEVLAAAAEISEAGIIPAKYLSYTKGFIPNRGGGKSKSITRHDLRPDLYPYGGEG